MDDKSALQAHRRSENLRILGAVLLFLVLIGANMYIRMGRSKTAVIPDSSDLATGTASLRGEGPTSAGDDPLVDLASMSQSLRMLPTVLKLPAPVALDSTSLRNIFQWRKIEQIVFVATLGASLPVVIAPEIASSATPTPVIIPRVSGTFVTGGRGGAFIRLNNAMFLVMDKEKVPGTKLVYNGTGPKGPSFTNADGERLEPEALQEARVQEALDILKGEGASKGYPIGEVGSVGSSTHSEAETPKSDPQKFELPESSKPKAEAPIAEAPKAEAPEKRQSGGAGRKTRVKSYQQ
ncbi:MAG: hypothetical protein HQM09_13020 [Candidatus Riflebacteria bacterium]|nr:hypothetical protein [Candidatus Riflebacteria bacterium]